MPTLNWAKKSLFISAGKLLNRLPLMNEHFFKPISLRIVIACINAIDKIRLRTLLYSFFGGVILFGSIYYYNSKSSQDNGIRHTFDSTANITFRESIYFSVVTITTLGYGDIRPMGWSRLFVCIEVFFGIAIIGIILSKLTSIRLSAHVKKLFASDVRRKLESFISDVQLMDSELLELIKIVSNAFQEVPGRKKGTGKKIESYFTQSITKYQSQSQQLYDYLALEIIEGDYILDVPSDILEKCLAAIDHTLFLLGQLVIGMPSNAKAKLFVPDIINQIRDSLNNYINLTNKIKNKCTGKKLTEICVTIEMSATQIYKGYFDIPMTKHLQPDQVI
jgi:hypothetical protein